MDKRKIEQIRLQYDSVIHNVVDADIEFWYARELMLLLGYERWENFDKAISRAMESCDTSGITVSDHFREVTLSLIHIWISLKSMTPITRITATDRPGIA